MDISFSFYVLNDGNLAIEKNRTYYTILIPKNIDVVFSEGIKTENATVLIPNKNNYQNDRNVYSINGIIPVLINPRRIIWLFSAKLRVGEPIHCFLKSYISTPEGYIPSCIKVDSNNEPVENFDSIRLIFTS